MAVSDLFNPLTIMPIQIVQIISGSESWKVDRPWILGNILCKLSYFLPDVSLAVSIESLVLISMDRFASAVFTLNTKLESMKARFISIVCTWISAVAVHAPYFYTFRLRINPYDNKPYCKSYWGDKSYIGETKRKFSTRLKEHQKAVEKKHSHKSALAEHCLHSGHTISWESAKILRTSTNWRNRRILEAWEINTCRNPLNRDDGMHLPHEFLNLALRDRT